MTERAERIKATVEDGVARLLHYDRKEDEELPRGAIEEAIATGEVTLQDIVGWFEAELEEGIQ